MGSHFVIAGDLNADPIDGASHKGAAAQLLNHSAIDAAAPPKSKGGSAFAALQGRKNSEQKGDPATDTSDFSDRTVGNLRVDYCLPSNTLHVKSQAVFWPEPDDPEAEWVKATDHRMVYIDVIVPK
jgi:endonuclease/exonuclease/phosphatase family metal-dependent hydrolase